MTEKGEKEEDKKEKSGIVTVGKMTFIHRPQETKIIQMPIKIILFAPKILVIY